MPPYLAGRKIEEQEFRKLLRQDTILENMILTGLRGVGKTVLLERFKPIAIQDGWLWVGTDLSESASISERSLAVRILTDLSVVTSSIVVSSEEKSSIGFVSDQEEVVTRLGYNTLAEIYETTPGLAADKIKRVLEVVSNFMPVGEHKGMIFAYDEAQNLSDHSEKEEHPLSLLLDVFQSIQRKGIKFMLILTGLPTLFPKLVEARTYSERMFHVIFLDRLNRKDSIDAIEKPMEDSKTLVKFSEDGVEKIYEVSGGYPYFIQFVCREAYDVFLQKLIKGDEPFVPVNAIIGKLDSDFFAGRWARATDRQRELLNVIAQLDNCDTEFTVQEIVGLSKIVLEKPFSSSHANQMLVSLGNMGLVYKNRHGRYSFAVPLLGRFIMRQIT